MCPSHSPIGLPPFHSRGNSSFRGLRLANRWRNWDISPGFLLLLLFFNSKDDSFCCPGCLPQKGSFGLSEGCAHGDRTDGGSYHGVRGSVCGRCTGVQCQALLEGPRS